MKFLAAIILGAAMAFALGGCRTEIEPSPDNIIISVDMSDVESDIYRVDMSYCLKNDLMGGMACSNANRSKLDESVNFMMCENDFPSGSKPQDFSFHLTLCPDKDGIDGLFSDSDELVSTNECDLFDAEYGKVYKFKVTGDLEKGLELISDKGEN